MPTPLPTLPGVFYARVHGTWEGLPSSNLFTFTSEPAPATGAEDFAAAQQVAASIATRWATLATALFVPAYSADEVSCYPLGHPVEPAAVEPCTAVGGVSDVVATAPTAVVIAHSVTRRGRGSQSRTYLSPVGKASVTADGRSLLTADLTVYDTHFSAFITGVVADLETVLSSVVTYVQLSKKGTGATYPIVASHTESLLSTQRRRTRRNGG